MHPVRRPAMIRHAASFEHHSSIEQTLFCSRSSWFGAVAQWRVGKLDWVIDTMRDHQTQTGTRGVFTYPIVEAARSEQWTPQERAAVPALPSPGLPGTGLPRLDCALGQLG